MTEYEYTTTWKKGMNTRPKPNVNNDPNGAVGYGQLVKGVEVWTSPADGVNVKKGDKWMRLDDPIEKWVAVIHMGVVYGVLSEGEEPTPPSVTFPEYFDLTDPEGNTKRYVLVG